jgi:hypothetical protein
LSVDPQLVLSLVGAQVCNDQQAYLGLKYSYDVPYFLLRSLIKCGESLYSVNRFVILAFLTGGGRKLFVRKSESACSSSCGSMVPISKAKGARKGAFSLLIPVQQPRT